MLRAAGKSDSLNKNGTEGERHHRAAAEGAELTLIPLLITISEYISISEYAVCITQALEFIPTLRDGGLAVSCLFWAPMEWPSSSLNGPVSHPETRFENETMVS